MNKIDIGQVLSVVANFGVIVGIAFLAYEMRQNTIAISGATVQSISDQSKDAAFIGVENPAIQLAWQRVGKGIEFMTPEDQAVLAFWYTGMMRVAENRYRQAGLGTVNAEVIGQIGGSSVVYRHPYFGFYWQFSQEEYPKDFANWVEANLLPEVRTTFNELPAELMLPEARDAEPRR